MDSKWKPIKLESRRAESRDRIRPKKQDLKRDKHSQSSHSRISKQSSRNKRLNPTKQTDSLPSWLQLASKPTISSQAKIKRTMNHSPRFCSQFQDCSTLESSGSEVEIVAKILSKSRQHEQFKEKEKKREYRGGSRGQKIQNQNLGQHSNRGYDTPSFKDHHYKKRLSPPRFQLSPHMLEASLKLQNFSPPPIKSCQKRINTEVGSGKIVRRSPKVFQRLKEEELERKIEEFKIKYCIKNCPAQDRLAPEETHDFTDFLLSGAKRNEGSRKNLREMARKKYQIDEEFNKEREPEFKLKEPTYNKIEMEMNHHQGKKTEKPPTWVLMREFYRIQEKAALVIQRAWLSYRETLYE